MAVLLTSSEDSSTKLLGVPKLLSGTGKETANAVIALLESWDIGTDTVTASNTGHYSGACVLLENLLERPLLWLACRHHIFEVFSMYGPIIWSRHSIIQTLSIYMADLTPSTQRYKSSRRCSNRCFAVSSDHDGWQTFKGGLS